MLGLTSQDRSEPGVLRRPARRRSRRLAAAAGALVLAALTASSALAEEPDDGFQAQLHWGASVGVTNCMGFHAGCDPMVDLGSVAQVVYSRPGHIWGLGLHLGVQVGLNNREITERGQPATTLEARTVAVDLGFVYRIWGLWLSAGINFTHLGHVGDYRSEYEDMNLPACFLAIGYDLTIWRGLGVRIMASGSTTFVTMFRGMIGAGPVVRF